MVCLGLELGVGEWKVQTNPLSYGGTPFISTFFAFPSSRKLFFVALI